MADSEVTTAAPVEQRLAALESRVNELEDENERLREELEEERQARHDLIHSKSLSDEETSLGSIFVAGAPLGNMVQGLDTAVGELETEIGEVDADLREEVEEVREEIDTEQRSRGQQDAKLRRRIEALADEMDVEIVESDIMGEDKIRRVLKHGASDLNSNPTVTELRAECLLRNIGKWGNKQNDAGGKRIHISSPTVADRMEDVRDERLNTPQIKRVFKKVEEWGADSPREVRWKPGGRGGGNPNKLRIELNTE